MSSKTAIPSPLPIKVAFDPHQASRNAEAEVEARQILAADPHSFHALHLLGLLAFARGAPDEAVVLIGRAVKEDPTSAPAFLHLGLAHLGLAHRTPSDLEAACLSFRNAAALAPHDLEARKHLALLLQELDRPDEAAAEFVTILSLAPDFAEAHKKFGDLHFSQRNTDKAIACYRKALMLDPSYADAHFALGRALASVGTHDEFEIGALLWTRGAQFDALTRFDNAVSLRPDYVEARWGRAMSQLTPVCAEDEDPQVFRKSFADAVAALDAWFTGSRIAQGHKAVGNATPFLVAYYEQNNCELLSRYGDLCARLMRHWQDAQVFVRPVRAPTERIRIGIASAHVHDHSVWNAIVSGWCRHLDPARFALHIFALGDRSDAETAYARARSAHFVQDTGGLRQWVDAILGQQLDALIYPEIGMNALTIKLASLRLAPVQIATWGHPETTGLPTVDYYLSANDFEPAGAERCYREHLVKLPNLGCCYQPLPVNVADADLARLSFDPRVPLLLCLGTPYKYAPQHDWVLVEIARRLGRCRLVFVNHVHRHVSEKLHCRLETSFARAGARFSDHAEFVPWLPRPTFYALMKRADVMLDTIGFSGFNTAMQAVECALPVVTREGRFMRGRFASGILKRMGLPDLVADSDKGYVDIAVRLVKDPEYRSNVRERLAASRGILFEDLAPIRALEDFLTDVTSHRAV
jgi:protein O-GlcNAc transferase